MSTQRRRVNCACYGCESYGADCGKQHAVEVVNHNASCKTTIRLLRDEECVGELCMDWDERDALATALAGRLPCVMCGVQHCLICGKSKVGSAHPEYCTCP